jgi:hypothetical protein
MFTDSRGRLDTLNDHRVGQFMLTNKEESRRTLAIGVAFGVALIVTLFGLAMWLGPVARPGSQGRDEPAKNLVIGPPPVAPQDSTQAHRMPRQKRLYSIAEVAARTDKGLIFDAVISNPKRYFDRASAGDGDAAMAVYYVVAGCRSFRSSELNETRILQERREVTSEECFTIPEKKAATPEHWLRVAANAGRNDARLMYAIETGARLNAMYRRGVEPSADLLADGDRAVSYLELAASEGVKEAYQQLAVAYESGLYGKQDRVLAYAYAAAVKRIDASLADESLLRGLESQLRPGDFILAESQSTLIAGKCCSVK